jgi:hypothetical protein
MLRTWGKVWICIEHISIREAGRLWCGGQVIMMPPVAVPPELMDAIGFKVKVDPK